MSWDEDDIWDQAYESDFDSDDSTNNSEGQSTFSEYEHDSQISIDAEGMMLDHDDLFDCDHVDSNKQKECDAEKCDYDEYWQTIMRNLFDCNDSD